MPAGPSSTGISLGSSTATSPSKGTQSGGPRAWLAAYAAATATTASYNNILNAATPGDGDKPAKTTVIGYRDVLTGLWLLAPVPGWNQSRSALARLQEAPKHQLADPALAACSAQPTTPCSPATPCRCHLETGPCSARCSSRWWP